MQLLGTRRELEFSGFKVNYCNIYIYGNLTLYRTGVITEYIRHQNTPIKEQENCQNTRHQILAVL